MAAADTTSCERCGASVPSWQSVSLGSVETGYEHICTACMNAHVAERMGLDYQHQPIEPITFHDRDGKAHTFHFTLRLHGTGSSLEAYELVEGAPGGFIFKVFEEGDVEPKLLFPVLVGRIGRAMERRCLEYDERVGYPLPQDRPIAGRIEWDSTEGTSVWIDGRRFTWLEFGEMWRHVEGQQFRLEIVDPTREV